VPQRFAKYAWSVLGFNVIVILWGALVRASKSGDGCGNNWPLCNGSVVPTAPRIATVIEFTHRLSTGLALIAVVAMAIWAFRAFAPGPVRRAAAASVFFILSEALLGAGLVLLRYVGEDASAGRAIYLSAHLINTLLMLGAIALTAYWGSGRGPVRLPQEGPVPKLIGIALAGALLVGVSGAIAALGDTHFPVTSLRAGWEADFSSASHIFIRLRIWHPLIATLTGIYTAAVALWIARRTPQSRNLATAVVTLVALQLTAGVVNLTLLAPIWMQMIHLLLADLLWISLVLFSASATGPRPEEAGDAPDVLTWTPHPATEPRTPVSGS
jgi:heme a synthase